MKEKEHSNTSHARIEFFALPSLSPSLCLPASLAPLPPTQKCIACTQNAYVNTLRPSWSRPKISEILDLLLRNLTKTHVCVRARACVCHGRPIRMSGHLIGLQIEGGEEDTGEIAFEEAIEKSLG